MFFDYCFWPFLVDLFEAKRIFFLPFLVVVFEAKSHEKNNQKESKRTPQKT